MSRFATTIRVGAATNLQNAKIGDVYYETESDEIRVLETTGWTGVTPNAKRITTISGTLVNNATDELVHEFDMSYEGEVIIHYHIRRRYETPTDTILIETGTIRAIYDSYNEQWLIGDYEYHGDDSGVNFDIITNSYRNFQLVYSSGNITDTITEDTIRVRLLRD